MGSVGRMGILLAGLCLASMVDFGKGDSTWMQYFTSTVSTLDWNKVKLTFSTDHYNYTTKIAWWDVTTSTVDPTLTSTIATTEVLFTTPPKQPEIVESTDTIFLIIIIVACLIGLIICLILVYQICQMMNKKHKKTKRLRVKPLKADQAFASVMHPGMGMGMTMDPMGMGGLMPPMDTGMMGMPGAMDPFGMPDQSGMNPGAMCDPSMDPNVMMQQQGGFGQMDGQKQWMV